MRIVYVTCVYYPLLYRSILSQNSIYCKSLLVLTLTLLPRLAVQSSRTWSIRMPCSSIIIDLHLSAFAPRWSFYTLLDLTLTLCQLILTKSLFILRIVLKNTVFDHLSVQLSDSVLKPNSRFPPSIPLKIRNICTKPHDRIFRIW